MNRMDHFLGQHRHEQEITHQALHKLLAQLDEDSDQAALKFETIRQKLVKFFEYRKIPFAEEYTDEAVYRVMRKVAEDEVILDENPARYFLGVAGNLIKEYLRKMDRTVDIEDVFTPSNHLTIDPNQIQKESEAKHLQEQQLECLEQCLNRFSAEDRDLIMHYYQDDGETHIDSRKALAHKLGIQINNLRIRMHRMREKLERCVEECLKKVHL